MSNDNLNTVPFDLLTGFTPLARRYYSDYEELDRYYSGNYADQSQWPRKAELVAAHPRNRENLVDILLEQNLWWGMDDLTRRNIESLRDPQSVVIITGQQVGLYAGPLYTIYKIITTLQLARRMSEVTQRPVIPVFWLEGDDHDFEEVSAVNLLSGREVVPIRYAASPLHESGNTGPVGRIVLDDQIESLNGSVEDTLQHTEFTDELLDWIRKCYAPGTNMRDAFGLFVRRLLPDTGLVYISTADVRLKRMAAPLFIKELEEYDESAARLLDTSRELEGTYHAQVRGKPTNIFMLEDDGRFSLEVLNGKIIEKGTGRQFSHEALQELVNTSPERFSPNVVLRPLMQDTLLPTAAYVGGPGEISYFAQYKSVYEWAGVPMPLIYPRASVTLLEPAVRRILEKYDLGVTDLQGDFEQIFRDVVLDRMDVDLEEAFDRALGDVDRIVAELEPVAQTVDPTLVKSAQATKAALQNELQRYKAKLVRAEKRNHDQVRIQLEKARQSLFPQGRLQERTLSMLYFLNKYGLDLPVRLLEDLSLDTRSHQVYRL